MGIGIECLHLGREEVILTSNVLNEVLHGFPVAHFSRETGAEREEGSALLGKIAADRARAGASLGRHEARIARNALRVTLREPGADDFQTRTGYSMEEGEFLATRLEAFLQEQAQGAGRVKR